MIEDRKFSVVVERDEDGIYVASVPELLGCHTQAKTLDKLMERTKEVIELCLDNKEEGNKSKFVGVQLIEV